MRATIEIYTGTTSPSVADVIEVNEAAFDLTGSTVKLMMRPETAATLKVNTAAVITSAPAGAVRYDWASADVDTPGRYRAWWRVHLPSGKDQDSAEFIVVVLPHDGTNATAELCSLEDVKAALEIESGDQDDLLELLITAASKAITNRYRRDFAPLASLTRRFAVTDPYVQLAPYDLQAPTLVQLHPELGGGATTLVLGTDYDLAPVGQGLLGTYTALQLSGFLVVTGQHVFRFGYANLDVTGTWGPLVTPPDVQRACVATVGSWRDRAVAQYAIQDTQGGRELTPDSASTWAIPSAAHRLLQPYERMEYA